MMSGLRSSRLLSGEFPLWLRLAIILAVALVLRASAGYAGVPSVDDFCYLPLAWARLDPTLFVRDDLLRGFMVHVPLWPPLVLVLQKTIGLAPGLFLLTWFLSVATVAAAWRIYRAVGGAGWLFPMAAMLVFAGRFVGIGRGEYGGAFGDQFHMQWLALCLLLWTFERFLQGSSAAAGILLGATFYAHPVVAIHGALTLLVASLLRGRRGIRPLLSISTISFVLAAPLLTMLVREWLVSSGVKPICDVAKDGYLFRTPQEYSIRWESPLSLALMMLLVVVGFLSFLLPARGQIDRKPAPDWARKDLAGVCAGLLLLFASAVVVHGDLLPAEWLANAAWPFQLHLSRSSPLLLTMAALALVSVFDGAVSEDALSGASAISSLRLFWLALMLTFAFLLVVQVKWSPLLALLFAASLSARLAELARWRQATAALMLALGVFAGVDAVRSAKLETPLEAEKRTLFSWGAAQTAKDALFITPPGLEEFRYYTRRSQYVDFKIFPASRNSLICEWRRRIDLVAAPDKQSLENRGWDGIIYWDRSYAVANTPARIAALLLETHADYLVYDRYGLQVPPFLDVVDTPDDRLRIAYENSRFRVYRLSELAKTLTSVSPSGFAQ